jgi:seryl-tRNA synthetase
MGRIFESLFDLVQKTNQKVSESTSKGEKLKKKQKNLLQRIKKSMKTGKSKKNKKSSAKIKKEKVEITDLNKKNKNSEIKKKDCIICNDPINPENNYMLINCKINKKNTFYLFFEQKQPNDKPKKDQFGNFYKPLFNLKSFSGVLLPFNTL